MESNGNSVKDAEKQITRVLFCGPRFPASHEYTIEYLQNHSHIKVKWNQYYMLFISNLQIKLLKFVWDSSLSLVNMYVL